MREKPDNNPQISLVVILWNNKATISLTLLLILRNENKKTGESFLGYDRRGNESLTTTPDNIYQLVKRDKNNYRKMMY
jgi:hypothetical protein